MYFPIYSLLYVQSADVANVIVFELSVRISIFAFCELK